MRIKRSSMRASVEDGVTLIKSEYDLSDWSYRALLVGMIVGNNKDLHKYRLSFFLDVSFREQTLKGANDEGPGKQVILKLNKYIFF